ncbi:MAG: DUF1549 domain-containing protein [Verrucomicrobiota bacterium]|nr:DUF1549 domain-containing protein [Verrucomicrobiota bacterium]
MRWVLVICIAWTCGAEPLYQRIDQLVAARVGTQPLARTASDAEFLRRLYLDFVGRIPSAEEVQKFLADKAKDKRTKLVDRLFAQQAWGETMAARFHVMLRERRGKDEEWGQWLANAFRENKRWDVMVREMLAPQWTDEERRGAGFFITKRLEKYGQNPTDFPGLTTDVGRMFMGVDLQCAQCHRHLSVKDYKQVDFQGLYTAFSNLRRQGPNDSIKVTWAAEGIMKTELEYGSVFSETKKTTGPRVPFGEEIAVPVFAKGEEWAVKPDRAKKIVGVPTFSPLKEISARLTTADNSYFTRNIANRAWFLMMGRGLIEPLDLAHKKNPPSHPELLDLLAKEITAKNFDMKWLFRELALTQTYQRSSTLPSGKAPPNMFTAALERPLAAEVLLRNVLQATGEAGRLAKLKDDDEHSLKSFEELFQATFANAPREPELVVNATLKAALFLRNNETLLWLVQRRDGNLVDQLAKLKSSEEIADVVFLNVLSRPPLKEEWSMVDAFLENQTDRDRALGDLVWALLSSTEFFVNH